MQHCFSQKKKITLETTQVSIRLISYRTLEHNEIVKKKKNVLPTNIYREITKTDQVKKVSCKTMCLIVNKHAIFSVEV